MKQKLSPGSRLGPYTIVRLIAKGGMGEVYEAYEEVLHRSVALKVIADDAISEIPAVLRLFHTEGKALAQLNHPNVVTIYQLGQDKDIHYIAMEYIAGIPLDEYIQKNKPDFKRDLYIFYRILLGVQALHRKGIIHRDLKPKNVIIQGEKGVKIVDFGIAELVREPQAEEQLSTVVMGSVYYMSPEVSRGQAATFQSDIWSLGVILYQLLTRQRPFSGTSQTEILTKIREDALVFPSVSSLAIPPKYKDITHKMCSRSLNDRYHSVDEIIHDLGVSNAPATTTSPSNNRVTEVMVGLAALSLVAFAGWQFFRSSPTRVPAEAPIEISVSTTSSTTTTTSAPIAQATTTSTTAAPPHLVEPAIPKSEPRAAERAPLIKIKREKLPITKLKSEQAKVILNFKPGAGGRDLASVQSSILNIPILSWNKTTDADSYRLQIASDKDFRKPILTKEVQSTSFKWESVMPGTFFWRVQALAKARPRGDFSEAGTLQIQLPAPVITKPVFKFLVRSQAKDGTKNMVDWNPLPMADLYRVSIHKKDPTHSSVASEIVSQTQLTLKTLPPGDYDLQITAVDEKRQVASLPSAPSTIQIQKAHQLATPDLQQPSNGTTVPSQGTMITPIACSWSAVKQVLDYEFQLSSDPDFKKIVHQTTTNKTQYVLILPLPQGKFYWRVRATSKDDDPSAWSKTRSFKID
jgi:serine/threonine protein kinase